MNEKKIIHTEKAVSAFKQRVSIVAYNSAVSEDDLLK